MTGFLIVDLTPKAPRSSDLMLVSLVIQRYNGVCQTYKEYYVTKLLSSVEPVKRYKWCVKRSVELYHLLTRQLINTVFDFPTFNL